MASENVSWRMNLQDLHTRFVRLINYSLTQLTQLCYFRATSLSKRYLSICRPATNPEAWSLKDFFSIVGFGLALNSFIQIKIIFTNYSLNLVLWHLLSEFLISNDTPPRTGTSFLNADI